MTVPGAAPRSDAAQRMIKSGAMAADGTSVSSVSRLGRAVLIALVAAATLTGCYRAEMNLVVHSDDTVSGDFVLAVSTQALALAGSSIDEVFPDDDVFDFPTEVTPYDEDGMTGKRFTFTGAPLAEVSQGELELRHTDEGTFVLEGTLGFGDAGEEMRGGTVIMAVTFPGEVITASGTITEATNTVTWSGDGSAPFEVYPEARDGRSWWSGLVPAVPLPVLLGGTALVLGGLAAALVLVTRRRRRRVVEASWPVIPPVASLAPYGPAEQVGAVWAPQQPAPEPGWAPMPARDGDPTA